MEAPQPIPQTVRVVVRLEGEEETHALPSLPLSFNELRSSVYNVTGAVNFKLKYQDQVLTSTKDMVVSFLEHKGDCLEFIVDEDLVAPSYFGAALDQHMNSSHTVVGERFPQTNGVVSKEHVLQLIAEIVQEARTRLVATSKEFMNKRQEVYRTDEEKWRQITFQQLALQDRIMLTVRGDVCRRHGVTPEIFDKSCFANAADPDISLALEELPTKCTEAEGPLPDSLTKDKLREVLNYSCDFLEEYLRSHPPRHPSEVILLKVREADEIMQRFGYDEGEVAGALTHYEIDKLPEWADIRERLSGVMTSTFGFDPSSA